MLYITGDPHIPIDIHKLASRRFCPEPNSHLIICGDFGGVWDGSGQDRYWLKWLTAKPFVTLFADGNHENFERLARYPVEERFGGKVHRVTDRVFHLMRGQVFTIEGQKIFVMGGASSHDKIHRVEGKSWWPRELPSTAEYEQALHALDLAGWEVDLVVSHCAPDSIQRAIAADYERDKLTNFLETVRQDLTYRHWYFGHYHIDREIDERHTALYKQIQEVNPMSHPKPQSPQNDK